MPAEAAAVTVGAVAGTAGAAAVTAGAAAVMAVGLPHMAGVGTAVLRSMAGVVRVPSVGRLSMRRIAAAPVLQVVRSKAAASRGVHRRRSRPTPQPGGSAALAGGSAPPR